MEASQDPSLTTSTTGRFQVLSLDGGGVKALFTAHVLARFEDDHDVRIQDHFDLIAGTSAGGILALALGAGIRPAEIADRYEKLATTVFPTHRRLNPARLWHSTYDGSALRDALGDVLGACILGDSTKRLLIPSWDVQNNCVHIFKTPHHPRLKRDWKLPMTEVALATSAAPSYFPAAYVDGHRLVDGGVWANNPSVLAIVEATSMLDAPLGSVHVLNVGTTSSLPHHKSRLDRAGLLPWARRAPELILTASSDGTQGTAEHLVGPHHFHRIDAQAPPGVFRLDHSDSRELRGAAAAASRNLGPVFDKHFGAHSASPYQPYQPATQSLETTS